MLSSRLLIASMSVLAASCNTAPSDSATESAALTLPPLPAVCNTCYCQPGYAFDNGVCASAGFPDQPCENQCTGNPLQLGAWVDPKGKWGPPNITGLENFIADTVPTHLFRFDYSLHYEGFDKSAQKFPTDVEQTGDGADGRIPIISLGCETDDDRANLVTEIQEIADAYGKFGSPVMVRYCWEMNLVKNGVTKAGRTTTEFKSDWQNLHDTLIADQKAEFGGTNVLWFFCPADVGGSDYYPGDRYVDYAGFDAYDKKGDGLEATLSAAYSKYAFINRPFIVGETGAHGVNQLTYLDVDAVATFANDFPKIVGVDYFDAYNDTKPFDDDWTLSGYPPPPGKNGLDTFRKFVVATKQ